MTDSFARIAVFFKIGLFSSIFLILAEKIAVSFARVLERVRLWLRLVADRSELAVEAVLGALFLQGDEVVLQVDLPGMIFKPAAELGLQPFDLVQPVAVQTFGLEYRIPVEVQRSHLAQRRWDAGNLSTCALHVVGEVLRLVLLEARVVFLIDCTELLVKGRLADACLSCVLDLVSYESDPFKGVAFARSPKERRLGFHVPE